MVLWFICGMILVGGFFIYRVSRFPYLTKEHHAIAQKQGYDLQEYNDLIECTQESENGKKLTGEKWLKVKTLLSSKNDTLRQMACAILPRLRNTAFEQEAEELAMKLTRDKFDGVEATALLALQRLDSPLWRDEASSRLQDTSELVRNLASRLLSNYGAK